MLARLEGLDTAISAGGSLSNTLLGLARLSAAGAARWGGTPLRVGMAGLVGSDPLGEFFCAQVRSWRAEWVGRRVGGIPAALTGRCRVHSTAADTHTLPCRPSPPLADAAGGSGCGVATAAGRSHRHGCGADRTGCVADDAQLPGHAR